MPATRREFLRTTVVGGITAAALAVPALKVMAQPGMAQQEPMPSDIHHPADPAHLTALEAKHWPKLKLSKNAKPGQPADLMIQIGHDIHPMTADHHIEWIEVWADGMRLQRLDFTEPIWSQPLATVKLVAQKASTITVRTHCNLHGYWENTIQLKPSAPAHSGY